MGADRYISQFTSHAGQNWQIKVWDREWVGVEGRVICVGPEGFELSYDGDTSNIFKPVITSRLEWTYNIDDSNAETFLNDVATGDPDRFRVVITKGTGGDDYESSLYWQGFIQGEGVSIDDMALPYPTKMAASDISFFSEVDFSGASGMPVTGNQTMTDWMLGGVLDYPGYRAWPTDGVYSGFSFFRHNINWRGNEMASTGDPFNLCQVDGHTFYKYDKANAISFSNCFDVAGEISKFFGCRFFQSDGTFWLQQIDDLNESTSTVYEYNHAIDLVSTTTGSDLSIDVDRANLYQMAGGSTSFLPGIKRVDKRLNFRRNYLEGQSADQDNPLSFAWTPSIPVLDGYVNNVQAPQFTLKFQIKYAFFTEPRSNAGDIIWPRPGENIGVMPIWRLKFAGDGDSDGLEWTYSRYFTHLLESYAPSYYKTVLANAGNLKNVYIYPGWLDETVSVSAYQDYYEIIPPDEYTFPINEAGDDYEFTEQTMEVELNLPYFANGSTFNNANYSTIIQGLENGSITLELYGFFNRWYTQWNNTNPEDYMTWSVENFELYVHGDSYEKELLSKVNFRVENDSGNREKVELESGGLCVIDKRTWHTVEVWDGAEYVNSPLWYRAPYTGLGDLILMNYLPAREAIGHRYRGIRLYNGGLLSTDPDYTPSYHNVIIKDSLRWIPIQGTFVASYDEWRNLSMVELTRDISDLTFEEIQEEGESGGYSISGGGSSGGGGSNGGGSESYGIPNYERATGATGSSYAVTGFSISGASGFGDDEINKSLQVYQDSTKLSHGIGYTISGQTITFTYDLDSSVIEIYSWL